MNLNFIHLMAPPAQGGGNPLVQFLPLLLIIVIFYFFMMRPQLKKAKEQKKFLENLKKGDTILTIGGIYGKVAELRDDNTVIMEVEDGSKLKISKNAISMEGAGLNSGA